MGWTSECSHLRSVRITKQSFRYWKKIQTDGSLEWRISISSIQRRPITDVTVQSWCDFSSLMLCRVLWLLMWWDDDSLSSSWFDSVCNLWHHPTYHSHPRPKRDTPPNTMGPPNIGCGRAFISDVFWNQIKTYGHLYQVSHQPSPPSPPSPPSLPSHYAEAVVPEALQELLHRFHSLRHCLRRCHAGGSGKHVTPQESGCLSHGNPWEFACLILWL